MYINIHKVYDLFFLPEWAYQILFLYATSIEELLEWLMHTHATQTATLKLEKQLSYTAIT